MDSGETKAKLNGAVRDALRKEKVAFIEVTTQLLADNVIVVTIVTPVESQSKADRLFGEVAKRFKGTVIRCEFKTPEELARGKAATLRMILQALTDTEPFTVESIAERTHEPSWVIVACLKALALKGILQHVDEYDDKPTWAMATSYQTFDAAISAAKDKGFDVG